MNKTPVGGWVYHTVTEDHIKLMARANFYNDGDTIHLDSKRPLGNSDVAADVCEILGWKMEGDDGSEPCWSSKQRKLALDVFDGLLTSIPVCITARRFQAGVYRRGAYRYAWDYAGEGEP